MAGSSRLSVIKWPSTLWKAYARDAEHPQIAASAALARDPHVLAARVLSEIAIAHAQVSSHYRARTTADAWRGVLRDAQGAVRLTTRHLLDAYGWDRWPLRPLLVWRMQRARRRARRRRGLA